METAAPSPKKTGSSRLFASSRTGAIALVFLIIGFEAALFIHRAAVTALVAHRDAPDTVYVREISPRAPEDLGRDDKERAPLGRDDSEGPSLGRDDSFVISSEGEAEVEKSLVIERHSPQRSPQTVRTRDHYSPRRVENFRFDPNTATLDDFQRLGFSEKQAQAILNYRDKGGRFRRADDFAKSYVVADSVFQRLRPYIDIPKLDINKADSAALTSLPGIGPYFAAKIVEYRSRLRGFSHKEQLMDIYHFDREKYDGLSDLISCSHPTPYPIWTLPEADLKQHPYIGSSAHGIVLYRSHNGPEALTVDGLLEAGVISEDQATKLRRIRLATP
ncbi:MAG: helix-hairpin-helix domain-containing protein [Bacteroidales bacterium]|nr:helix-hairpin-helix domain-containing protein [Bacteroidales bacterium]